MNARATAAAAALGLAAIAIAIVLNGGAALPLDVATTRSLQSAGLGSGWFADICKELNGALAMVAGLTVVLIVPIAGVGNALLAGVANLASWYVMEPLVKSLVARPRPSSELVTVFDIKSGFGFPSGAAQHSAVLVAAFLYFVWRSRLVTPIKWLVTVLGAIFCVVLAAGRVAAGAHWLSDVLGAWLLALGIVSLCAWAASYLRHLPRLTRSRVGRRLFSRTAVDGHDRMP